MVAAWGWSGIEFKFCSYQIRTAVATTGAWGVAPVSKMPPSEEVIGLLLQPKDCCMTG